MWKRILILALISAAFGGVTVPTAAAQTIRAEKIEIIERRPDGSMILTIDGVKYRAAPVNDDAPKTTTKKAKPNILLQIFNQPVIVGICVSIFKKVINGR